MRKLITILWLTPIITLFNICAEERNVYFKKADSALNTNSIKKFSIDSSTNKFSLNFFAKAYNENENIFLSPISAYYTLSMLYPGAKGNTKKELEDILKINSYDRLIESYNNLIIHDSIIKFNLANSFWYQNNLIIDSSYLKQLRRYKDITIKNVDFKGNPKQACSNINNWCSKATFNTINEIITPQLIKPETKLLLLNAIYFNAQWGKEFKKEDTKKNLFYSANGKKDSVFFMNITDYFNYSENDIFQAIEMPYKDYNSKMVVYLPKKDYTLSDVIRCLESNSIPPISNSEVHIRFPKFKMAYNQSLLLTFKKMGLNNTISFNSDYSGICKNQSIIMDDCIQQTYFEINEDRTIASAATMFVLKSTSNGGYKRKIVEFNMNRPFLYILKKNEQILFIGTIQNL